MELWLPAAVRTAMKGGPMTDNKPDAESDAGRTGENADENRKKLAEEAKKGIDKAMVRKRPSSS